jgi:hypothetical protein
MNRVPLADRSWPAALRLICLAYEAIADYEGGSKTPAENPTCGQDGRTICQGSRSIDALVWPTA